MQDSLCLRILCAASTFILSKNTIYVYFFFFLTLSLRVALMRTLSVFSLFG